MFGLTWGQVIVIVLVGMFLLGPERIPTAVQWVVKSLGKVRTMAAGAQAQLRSEIGPELDELRRQVAELQSLKELQDLKQLRDLHPRALLGKTLLGDDLSLKGLLGVDAGAQIGSGVAAPAAAPSQNTPSLTKEPATTPPAPAAPVAPAPATPAEADRPRFDPDAT